MTKKRYPNKGFGSPNFDKELQKKIASKGGKAAHAKGTAHEWNTEEAIEAGRKGGANSNKKSRRDK
jgi:general stress protein YciG